MEYFKKVMVESTPVMMLCTFIAMFSGVALSASEALLDAFPVILLLLPALNSMIGDACQVSVSRFSTHLYLGTIPPRLKLGFRVKEDLSGMFLHALVSLCILIAIGFSFALLSGMEISHVAYIIVALFITTFTIFFLMFFFLFVAAVWLFKHGKDPSNVLVPLTTSVIDFLSPVMLVLLMLAVA